MNVIFKKHLPFLLFVSFVFVSCTTKPPQVIYSNYNITRLIKPDSNAINLLAPYHAKLNDNLKEVIGFSAYGLNTKKPESALGNFMTDAMKTMAEKKFNKKITAAFINSGGIRSYIPKGEITLEKIYELMPFDNLIVLQQLNGIQLKEFLNHVCDKGGWPVSEGLTYSIKDRKLNEVLVEGILVSDTANYIIANSDYVANGGDNTVMLKKIPKENVNYLLRDALIDYAKMLTASGKTIDIKINNRITNAK